MLTRLEAGLRSAICWLDRIPLSLPLLLSRIAIAALFWNSGQTKIASWAPTVALFRDEYRLPLLPPAAAAALAASFELSCSTLLLCGLLTRLATLPLLAMTLVIEVFVYPEDWSVHLMWASILLLLLIRGGGVVSLDYCARRVLAGVAGTPP